MRAVKVEFSVIFLTAIGLLVSGLPCAGQQVPSNIVKLNKPEWLTQHRLYAGVGVAAQLFDVVSDTYPIQEVVVRPLQAVVGYQISSHIAVQGGYLQRNPAPTEIVAAGINSSGQPYQTTSYYDQYDGALPLLFRYNIGRHPMHRLHVDALLGTTTVFHKYKSSYVKSVGGKVVDEIHSFANSNNLFATAGLSLGYRATGHVDILLEGTGFRNVTTKDYFFNRKFTWGIGAGVRYCFDVGKRVK